jgi:hypothetical protein
MSTPIRSPFQKRFQALLQISESRSGVAEKLSDPGRGIAFMTLAMGGTPRFSGVDVKRISVNRDSGTTAKCG